MVTLNCPLCCNETFSTPSSLKCHILNILDKLMCPWCRNKFQTLTELADHLEGNCLENLSADKETQPFEDGKGKVEIKNESILAKALLGAPLDTIQKVEPEEAQYYCQMCCVHFDEIEEHLRNFHEGQEIILEEEGNGEVKADVSDGHTIFIVNSAEEEGLEEEEEEEPITVTTFSTGSRKLNTITEHEIKDKEGRLYTRKFVKIDKFWLHDDKSPGAPKRQPGDIAAAEVETCQLLAVNKCFNCNLYFTNAEEYNGHRCSETEEFKCPHCSLPFPDLASLQDHSKTHPKEEATKKSLVGPFNCEVCNTTFPTFKSLRLHKRMHEPIKTREIEAPSKYGLLETDISEDSVRHMFICKICNKTYDKQYEAVHMNSHDANNGFNCEVCNRKFYTQANLDMHMKAHSNNKKFTCSYCKKPFVTYDALNDHLLNQCQKRPYACQFCGRRFARPHEKVKHERIHTGEKPHVCDICGKAFRVSYCLTLHLRTHSGTRPYQCKHCGKRFKSHSVYNHHMLTHSDVRAYKCPYCPKAFKTSVQLAGHKNSHIKPFTCTECNRPFASLYAVRAHMETHKKDNNLKYECWMCGALYSRAFALRDHLKQQHQQLEGDKAKAVALSVEDEEMEATNSILVTEDDIILGLDGATNIEIIENEAE